MALRLLRGGSPRCIGILSVLVIILLCLYYISIGQNVAQPKDILSKKIFSERMAPLLKYNSVDGESVKDSSEDVSDDNTSRNENDEQQCVQLKEATVDITTIEEYQKFDFQPNWMKNKEYWDAAFEDRFEQHLKNDQRPPLRVIIVPFSHNDPGWLKTFLNYFQTDSKQILNFVISKMQEYTEMTFIWAEISILQLWWDQAHPTKQRALKHLIQTGRFEITTGGWVMTDEANVHLYAMLDQLIEGHQWLKANLNYTPTTGWSIDPFGHGSTLPYLLASSGFEGMAIQRIHYAWKQYLAKYQYGDFMWTPYWSGNGINNVDRTILTHNMPFDIYSIKHSCGPHPFICLNFDFRKVAGEYTEYSIKAQFITEENVAAKADLLIEQYAKTASLYPHNVALIPLGDDFRYNREKEIEQQYVNYKKLIDHINNNPRRYNNTKISFGLPNEYFREIRKRYERYPSLKGDFFVYSDIFTEGRPAYWSGYFTTRPLYKMLSRELEQNLRALEILFTLAFNMARQQNHNNALRTYEKNYEKMTMARRNLGLFQHHDAITGTSKSVVMRDYGFRLFESIQSVVTLQERTIELLIQDGAGSDEHGFILNELERENFNKLPKKTHVFVQRNKSVDFVLFNSLAQERLEVVTLRTQSPDVKIVDQNGIDVPIQINPVWNISEIGEGMQTNTLRVADRSFEVIFVAKLPALSLITYSIVYSDDRDKKSRATIYCDDCRAKKDPKDQVFNVRKKQTGDVQLENQIMRLLFDGTSGFLQSITPKQRGKSLQCALNFAAYRSAQFHSGAYLFKPDREDQDVEKDVLAQYTGSQMIFITSGVLASDVTVIYGNFLVHTVRIYTTGTVLDNAIYIENNIDFEQPPKNRETELFMRFVTDIDNGVTPTMYTDQNGFQYHRRVKIPTLGIEANYYPITTSAFIQDNELRLTLLTTHAQGVAGYEPGHLEIMLDRRMLYDDYRGMGEGVVDNQLTRQKYWLVIEELVTGQNDGTAGVEYETPSNFVNQLINVHNYPAGVYFIEKPEELVHLTLSKEVHLLTENFPCDIHLLTLRTQTEQNLPLFPSRSALMVLHRPSATCKIKEIGSMCNGHYGGKFTNNGDNSLQLFSRAKIDAVHSVTLTGLTQHESIRKFNKVSIKPMDIKTFNLTFV